MCKLYSVNRLNGMGVVAKVFDCSRNKQDRQVGRNFTKRVDKVLSGRLVNHRVLVEFIRCLSSITAGGYILHNYLPFDAVGSRCIIGFWVIRLLWFLPLLEISQLGLNSKQWTRMSIIVLVPSHQWRFWNIVATTNEGYRIPNSEDSNSMQAVSIWLVKCE